MGWGGQRDGIVGDAVGEIGDPFGKYKRAFAPSLAFLLLVTLAANNKGKNAVGSLATSC